MIWLFPTAIVDYSGGAPPVWHAGVYRDKDGDCCLAWSCKHNHRNSVLARRCGKSQAGVMRRQLRAAGQEVL